MCYFNPCCLLATSREGILPHCHDTCLLMISRFLELIISALHPPCTCLQYAGNISVRLVCVLLMHTYSCTCRMVDIFVQIVCLYSSPCYNTIDRCIFVHCTDLLYSFMVVHVHGCTLIDILYNALCGGQIYLQ